MSASTPTSTPASPHINSGLTNPFIGRTFNPSLQDWWTAMFPRGRQMLTIQDANDCPVTIAYGEVGEGPPLILVHGIASWSYSWRHTIPALSQRFRVICFDAKNSGFSDKPLRPDKPNHKIIELERVIRALCDRPAIVVAESLGALATLAVAEEYPDLCDRLVLINVPIFPKQLPFWGMRLLAAIPLEWAQGVDRLRLTKPLAPLIQEWVYALRDEVVSDPTHITPEDVYWKTYPHIEFPHTIAKLTEEFQLATREIVRLEQGQPNLIRTIQENLPKITVPTLVMWADRDRWFPVRDGQELCDRLPNAQLQVIPNCGHYAAGGQPDFVNARILEFLRTEE